MAAVIATMGTLRRAVRLRPRRAPGFRQEAIEEAGIDVSGLEVGMQQNAAEEGEIGFDAADKVFAERAAQAGEDLRAVFSVGDELGQERIVVQGHDPAFVDAGVAADAGAAGRHEAGDASGRGEEIVAPGPRRRCAARWHGRAG